LFQDVCSFGLSDVCAIVVVAAGCEVVIKIVAVSTGAAGVIGRLVLRPTRYPANIELRDNIAASQSDGNATSEPNIILAVTTEKPTSVKATTTNTAVKTAAADLKPLALKLCIMCVYLVFFFFVKILHFF
jgi:hypothetical protein